VGRAAIVVSVLDADEVENVPDFEVHRWSQTMNLSRARSAGIVLP
jgi:hypothetical protein